MFTKPQFSRQSVFLLILMTGLITALVLATYSYRSHIQQKAHDALGKHLVVDDTSTATFIDLVGNPIAFPRTRSEITIVTLWASWSPFSAADFTTLETILDHHDERGVSVILLNRSESIETAERYLRQFPAPNRASVIIDQSDQYYLNVAGYTMPETIIYNRAGEVLWHVRGSLDETQLKTFLSTVI